MDFIFVVLIVFFGINLIGCIVLETSALSNFFQHHALSQLTGALMKTMLFSSEHGKQKHPVFARNFTWCLNYLLVFVIAIILFFIERPLFVIYLIWILTVGALEAYVLYQDGGKYTTAKFVKIALHGIKDDKRSDTRFYTKTIVNNFFEGALIDVPVILLCLSSIL